MHINTREEMRAHWLGEMKEGRTRFVLRAGILRFGAPMNLVLLIPLILGGGPRWTVSHTIMVYSLFTVTSGTIYGLLVWYFIRRRYGLSF